MKCTAEAEMEYPMGRIKFFRLFSICAIASCLVLHTQNASLAEATQASASPPSIAVLPFEIEDNSEEVDPPARHAEMLGNLTDRVGELLAAAKLYDVVPANQVARAVTAENSGTFLHDCNGCERDIAKRAGAQRVLTGWVFKMSTLIGTLHIQIKDVATGRIVYSRAFDFRGDDPRAWDRASKVFVKELESAS